MCALYTLSWSREVYEQFLEKHARGSAFLRELFEIGENDPVQWISENSRKWPDFKKAVKYIEKTYPTVEKWADFDYYTVVQYYRRVINKKALEKWPEPVDKVAVQRKL